MTAPTIRPGNRDRVERGPARRRQDRRRRRRREVRALRPAVFSFPAGIHDRALVNVVSAGLIGPRHRDDRALVRLGVGVRRVLRVHPPHVTVHGVLDAALDDRLRVGGSGSGSYVVAAFGSGVTG